MRLSTYRWLALGIVLLLGHTATLPVIGAPTTKSVREQEISLDAASVAVDSKTHLIVLTDVAISQGGTRVTADRARATGPDLNFDNSRWTFEGNVHIKAEPRGNLSSNQAVVDFRDKRIAKATVTGNPAEFEQQRSDSDQMARGHADEIVYDVGLGTVRLTNDAWLSDGQREISGPSLEYNIQEERVQATSEEAGKRVHIKIEPDSAPPRQNNTPQNKTPPNASPPPAPEPPKQP